MFRIPVDGFHYTLDTALRVLIGNLWLEALSYPIGITQNSYGLGGLIEFTSSPPLPAAIYRTFFGLGVTKDNLFSDPNVLPLSPPSLDGASEPQMHMTLLVTRTSSLGSDSSPVLTR